MEITEETLKNSQEFKTYIKDQVALIHNIYHDNKDKDACAYIVISKKNDKATKWDITRFWPKNIITNTFYVSIDYVEVSSEEVFALILNEYSSGLK